MTRQLNLLALTARGKAAFVPLNARQQQDVAALLTRLSDADQLRMIDAMRTIEQLLEPRDPRRAAYLLRPHQAGDMGWVVQRHGALYAQAYGYDATFESLVARTSPTSSTTSTRRASAAG